MKKRVSILVLCCSILIMLVMLTGCGNNNSSDKETKENNESNVSENTDYNKKGNLPGNISSGSGIVAKQGEWIYYALPKGDGIYKVKVDGTEKQRVVEEDSFKRAYSFHINVVGEWIYYVDYYDYAIYKVKTDGSDKQKIDTVGNNVYLMVDNGWIYYNSGGLTRVKLDGTDKQKILSVNDCNGNIVDGWVYYNNEEGIYKIKVDGTENQQIYSEDRVDSMVVDDGWLYFIPMHESKLYRMKIDGTDVQIINSGSFSYDSNFNVHNGWVYYNISSTDISKEGLYKMKIDGTEQQKICDKTALQISIIDDWLYCVKNYGDYEVYRVKTDGTGMETIENTPQL